MQVYRFSFIPIARAWTDFQDHQHPPREKGRSTRTIIADSPIEAKRLLEAEVDEDEKGTILKDVILEEVSPWIS